MGTVIKWTRGNINWLDILQKIRSDKKLKIFVIFGGLLVLIILVVLIIVLLPLIIKLINSISQTGLQGILNNITGFLDKILKGTSN
jgi:competence protein ComGC